MVWCVAFHRAGCAGVPDWHAKPIADVHPLVIDTCVSVGHVPYCLCCCLRPWIVLLERSSLHGLCAKHNTAVTERAYVIYSLFLLSPAAAATSLLLDESLLAIILCGRGGTVAGWPCTQCMHCTGGTAYVVTHCRSGPMGGAYGTMVLLVIAWVRVVTGVA